MWGRNRPEDLEELWSRRRMRRQRSRERFGDDDSAAGMGDESVKSGRDERGMEEAMGSKLTCMTGGGRGAGMKRRSWSAGELVRCEADQKARSPFIPQHLHLDTPTSTQLCVWAHISVACFWLTGHRHLVKQTQLMSRHDLMTSNGQILIVNQLPARRWATRYYSVTDFDFSTWKHTFVAACQWKETKKL